MPTNLPDSLSEAVPRLAVSGLCKSLGSASVLKNVDLSIFPGEILGLIGPNGAGKTTFIRIITGILQPDAGSITICGHDLDTDSIAARAEVGFAPEPESLPDQLTGAQLLELVASAKSVRGFDVSDLEEMSEQFDMTDKLNDEIGTYSRGMRQKTSILLALVGRPKLVVLDESLAGLDPVSAYALKNYLRRTADDEEIAILLSSHILETIEKYCSRIVILVDGCVRRVHSRREIQEIRRTTGMDLEELFIRMVTD